MAKLNSYGDSDAKAKVAEGIVEKCLDWTGNYEVENVRGIAKYQSMDIDLIVTDKVTGESFTMEVKSDATYQYGNFAIESVSNGNKNSLGWGVSTKADFVAITFPLVNKIYLLDGPKLVAWFTSNQHRFREITNGTTSREGGELYPSKFRLVSRALFEKEVGFVDVINVNEYLAS